MKPTIRVVVEVKVTVGAAFYTALAAVALALIKALI